MDNPDIRPKCTIAFWPVLALGYMLLRAHARQLSPLFIGAAGSCVWLIDFGLVLCLDYSKEMIRLHKIGELCKETFYDSCIITIIGTSTMPSQALCALDDHLGLGLFFFGPLGTTHSH